MAHLAIRVTFVDAETAYERWEAFGDSLYDRFADRVSSFARKRDGASYVVLLRDMTGSQVRQVASWCCEQSGVVTVAPMTDPEFWAAPSNAV